MKTFVTQPYVILLGDGTFEYVCCAPAMVAYDVKAYWPKGRSKNDVCCHKGRSAEICRKQTAQLREHLFSNGRR